MRAAAAVVVVGVAAVAAAVVAAAAAAVAAGRERRAKCVWRTRCLATPVVTSVQRARASDRVTTPQKIVSAPSAVSNRDSVVCGRE